jgi:V/A-type H+-transporting ATPase subunit D
MAEIKLTKTELRSQQNRMTQLKRYLPTLQLKKALLQAEVQESKNEIERLEERFQERHSSVEEYAALLAQRISIDLTDFFKVKEIKKHIENIAGVEI